MDTFRTTDRGAARRGTRGTAATVFTVELWPGERPPAPPRRRPWVTAAGSVLAGAAVVAGIVLVAHRGVPEDSQGTGAPTATASPGRDAYDECVLAGSDDPGEVATLWRAQCAQLWPGATASVAVAHDVPLPGIRDFEPRDDTLDRAGAAWGARLTGQYDAWRRARSVVAVPPWRQAEPHELSRH